jgi:hypothetical protein
VAARIIDHHVGLAILGGSFLEQRLHLQPVGGIAGERGGAGPILKRLQFSYVAGGERNLHAVLLKQPRQGCAQARTCAHDQCG